METSRLYPKVVVCQVVNKHTISKLARVFGKGYIFALERHGSDVAEIHITHADAVTSAKLK